MSHQCLADVFAPVEALNREIVKWNTWGHLAPKPGRKHDLTILFVRSEYDSRQMYLISTSGKVPDSPWFYDDVHEWMWTLVKDEMYRQETDTYEVYSKETGGFTPPVIKGGHVYSFCGKYTRYRNDKFAFVGTITEICLCNRRTEMGSIDWDALKRTPADGVVHTTKKGVEYRHNPASAQHCESIEVHVADHGTRIICRNSKWGRPHWIPWTI